MITFYLSGNRVFSTDKNAIEGLHNNKHYGKVMNGKVFLSLLEAAYLAERGKIEVRDGGKKLSVENLMKLGRERDELFDAKYIVYRDLRGKGYMVKSGLKFGSHFRVYGGRMDEHSLWLIWALPENSRISPNDITARVRVAHGVRKKMIMAVVDDDGDVTYYSVEWTKL